MEAPGKPKNSTTAVGSSTHSLHPCNHRLLVRPPAGQLRPGTTLPSPSQASTRRAWHTPTWGWEQPKFFSPSSDSPSWRPTMSIMVTVSSLIRWRTITLRKQPHPPPSSTSSDLTNIANSSFTFFQCHVYMAMFIASTYKSAHLSIDLRCDISVQRSLSVLFDNKCAYGVVLALDRQLPHTYHSGYNANVLHIFSIFTFAVSTGAWWQ